MGYRLSGRRENLCIQLKRSLCLFAFYGRIGIPGTVCNRSEREVFNTVFLIKKALGLA
ncbi:MAG: hypothetical protein PWQ12_959 [Clostridiales bacterium]|nr:hypothetical protein [Clostridiales bacterium]